MLGNRHTEKGEEAFRRGDADGQRFSPMHFARFGALVTRSASCHAISAVYMTSAVVIYAIQGTHWDEWRAFLGV